MLLPVLITLEAVAVATLLFSIYKVADQSAKNYILAFLACVMFFFLSYASFLIQTENCQNNIIDTVTESYNYVCQSCTGNSIPSLLGNESQISSITTTYSYKDPSCTINVYRDRNLSYFNLALAVFSLLIGLGMIFVRKRWL